MKKNIMMKQMVVCLVALALMAGWAGFQQPSSVEAATITVTEAWSDPDVFFTVSNNGYTDILEFAIGNNDAQWAWVDDDVSDPPTNLTEGRLAEKIDGYWKTMIGYDGGPIYRALTWMDNATGFEDYTRAFLYTSWGYNDSGYFGYLDDGFTNGYSGTTEAPSSPFAAYSEAGGTITGDTVPIPGAVWLLGSGLLCLVAVRRRKGKE